MYFSKKFNVYYRVNIYNKVLLHIIYNQLNDWNSHQNIATIYQRYNLFTLLDIPAIQKKKKPDQLEVKFEISS